MNVNIIAPNAMLQTCLNLAVVLNALLDPGSRLLAVLPAWAGQTALARLPATAQLLGSK